MSDGDRVDVLALLGSPRAKGNSETLLEALLEPACARGWNVEKLRISTLDFLPCRGCHYCEKHGECVQKDAMQEAYPRLLDARFVVLTTPVYYYNVPGKTKSFIDRSQALWARKYRPVGGKGPVPISEPGRKGFVVASGATRGKRLFEGLALTTRYFFDAIDVSDAGLYGVRGLEEADDARNKPEATAEAREAGERLFSAG
ncbi:MAG: flavodoxin family protein [Planctomycetota bacterium]|jgi:multimeric flavodoxin WrbA